MSTNKPTIKRRSRSSSSIPVSRNSGLTRRESTQKNLVVRPAGGEKKSIDRNYRRSISNPNLREPTNLLGRQGSGIFPRQSTLATPLNRGGLVRKSPLVSTSRKDNRPITDKSWQYSQTVKIRTFVAHNFSHLDNNSIKSGIALDVFIELTNCLFNMIDSRININRENYIEQILYNLKRYCYPVNVKPSLIKTVNTNYAWPHVVAILSWLVDVINAISEEPADDETIESSVINTAFELFNQFNTGKDEETVTATILSQLEKDLDKHLNIDHVAIQDLESTIANINSQSIKMRDEKNVILRELELARQNTENLTKKCDQYETQHSDLESKMKEHIRIYTDKNEKLESKIVSLTETEERLKEIIANQRYSVEDKNELTKELSELQNVQHLKEERLKQQTETINAHNSEMSELKRQIDILIHRHTDIIANLELVDPTVQKYHIRGTDVMDPSYIKKLDKCAELLKADTENYQQLVRQYREEIGEKMQLIKDIDFKITQFEIKLTKLNALDCEITMMAEYESKKYKKEMQQLLAVFQEQEKAIANVKIKKAEVLEPLESEIAALKEQSAQMKSSNEAFMQKVMVFFQNMHAQHRSNMCLYMDQIEQISNALKTASENQVKNFAQLSERLKNFRKEHEQQ